MARREHEVLLGAVVFIAVVIAVGASVWLSEHYAGAAGGYKLTATFDSVQGLEPGGWVTLRGVKVGKVLKIDIQDGRPATTLGFEKIRDLPTDSKLVLRSRGMLGEKEIEVQLGSDDSTLADGTTVAGSTNAGFEELTAGVADMARNLNRIVSKVKAEGSVAQVRSILTRVDQAAAGLQAVVDESHGTLPGTLDNLERAAAEARGIVGENRVGVKQAVANMNAAALRLAAAAEQLGSASTSLRELLANLSAVSEKIRDGEGTLGRLVQDERLYDDLDRAVNSVDSLASDIEKNPERYFKVSVF